MRKDSTELLVYLVESPEHGPGHRIFDDADILVGGGVCGIESEMERETDRFVRLGVIEASKDRDQIVFQDKDIAALGIPRDDEWRIGRLSPAYGKSELERQIFDSQVRAGKELLTTWEQQDDVGFTAYIPKKVRGGCLAALAGSICAVGEAFDKIEITALKYWYGRDWWTKIPTDDLILAEFPLTVPVRIRWGHGAHLVVSDVTTVFCMLKRDDRIGSRF